MNVPMQGEQGLVLGRSSSPAPGCPHGFCGPQPDKVLVQFGSQIEGKTVGRRVKVEYGSWFILHGGAELFEHSAPAIHPLFRAVYSRA